VDCSLRYEGVISKALKAGEGTKALNITLIDQGINGGTVTDLVTGYSPWYLLVLSAYLATTRCKEKNCLAALSSCAELTACMMRCRGHLDPHEPQSNISFAATIARDKPDIIAIQIGENDVMQQPSRGENVSCVLHRPPNQFVIG
jgi:hypothetical protein